jgi:hypothetical protein
MAVDLKSPIVFDDVEYSILNESSKDCVRSPAPNTQGLVSFNIRLFIVALGAALINVPVLVTGIPWLGIIPVVCWCTTIWYARKRHGGSGRSIAEILDAFMGLDVSSSHAIVPVWASCTLALTTLALSIIFIWCAFLWGPGFPGQNARARLNCNGSHDGKDGAECMTVSGQMSTFATWGVMVAFMGLTFARQISPSQMRYDQQQRHLLCQEFPQLQSILQDTDNAILQQKPHSHIITNKPVLGLAIIFVGFTCGASAMLNPWQWRTDNTGARILFVFTALICGTSTFTWVCCWYNLRRLYTINKLCIIAVSSAFATLMPHSISQLTTATDVVTPSTVMLEAGTGGNQNNARNGLAAWWALRQYYTTVPMAAIYRMAAWGISTILATVVIVTSNCVIQVLRRYSEEGPSVFIKSPGLFQSASGGVMAAVLLVLLLHEASSIYVEQQKHLELVHSQFAAVSIRSSAANVASDATVQHATTSFRRFVKGILPMMTLYDPTPEAFGIAITPAMLKVRLISRASTPTSLNGSMLSMLIK